MIKGKYEEEMKHADCVPRKILAILFLAVFFYYFSYFYIRYTKNGKFLEELQLLTSHSTSYCRLPLDLNPFDAAVRPFIVQLPEIKCSPPKREFAYENILTFVDSDGVLQTKNTSFKIFCTFCEVKRNESNEDKVTYGAKKVLPSSLDMNSLQIDFLSVECYDDKNKTIYNNTHFHPSSVTPKKSTIYKPSVIVMVIESMSRINFLRFLHKTRKEFESLPDVFYMKGFTKLDDNSYPNMVPFLTGLRIQKNEFPKTVKESVGPFDDLPFIWKEFEKNDYTTALIEDDPWFTLFNYLASGFKKQPTNWYPRPYWVHIYNENKDKRAGYCYNNETRMEILLQQTKVFLKKMRNSASFLFSFLIEVTHNNFNKAQNVDSAYASFIKEMKQEINDSVFILLGDHGNRFGKILSTYIGRVEERMPLFAIHLPHKLLQAQPHLREYMKLNENRLTTWLDAHKVLQDIANLNFSEISERDGREVKRAYSFIREKVPLDRDCESALIPENYCVCDEQKEISVNQSFVKDAAISLVTHVNTLLSSHSDLCETLTLNEIKNANVVFKRTKFTNDENHKILIVANVKPSDAMFSGELTRNWDSTWSVIGDVSRINEYGNQSLCVRDKVLRKYCYCHQLNANFNNSVIN